MSTAQEIVDTLNEENSNIDLAILSLSHEAALVRVNAIETLARCVSTNSMQVITALAQSALDPKNKVRLVGNTTVAYVAIARLLWIGTAEAITASNKAIEQIPAGQIDDLIYYLKSEGIPESILHYP